MTFEFWCEQVKNLSCQDMSPQEKNSLEWKFFDYLRNNIKDEVADRRSVAEPRLLVTAGGIIAS